MSHIQSILFDTKYFNEKEAIQWILDNGFKIHKPPDIKSKHIRIRQEDPNYNKYYYRTKHINKGIEFIMGYNKLKGSGLAYDDAKKIVDYIKNVFKKEGIDLESVGSYLRKAEVINDLDFITSSKLPDNRKFISTTVDYNGTPIKIDIWAYLKPNKLFAKFARSGSKRFNIIVRRLAKLKGYTLNDKGLFDFDGNKINIDSEKQLFDILGISYKTPSERI